MSAWTCRRCGQRVTANGAHCGGCHHTFTSDSAFDAHRTGSYDDRACLPVDGLDGWRSTPRGWTNAAEMPAALRRARRSAENGAGSVLGDPSASQAVYGQEATP